MKLVLLLSLFSFGCSQSSLSGASVRNCFTGRLCSSSSDTGCYSPQAYELDPMGIVGDNYICSKN